MPRNYVLRRGCGFKTFNEGEETTTSTGTPKTIRWTIDPLDGIPRGFAFVWRHFEISDLPQPMLACVTVTVPASALVRTIMANQEDPRMPAILEDADWTTWLSWGHRGTLCREG